MLKKLYSLLLAGVFAGWVGVANAGFIVDIEPGLPGGVDGLYLSSDQFLAVQFSTTQVWAINSIEGWISKTDATETATVAIYSDSGTLPGDELFSAAFNAQPNILSEWEGALGLNWLLEAGTYWATFEVRGGQTLNGEMPRVAESSLIGFTSSNGVWSSYNDNIGIRINASQPSPAPEPGTIALFGLGLAGLGWIKRKKA